MTAWVERQLEEVESLRAIFDESLSIDDCALEALSSAAAKGDLPNNLPPLTLSLAIRTAETEGKDVVKLAVVLPERYPEDGGDSPIVWLEPCAPEGEHIAGSESIREMLQEKAAEIATHGEECLLAVAQLASELCGEHLSAAQAFAAEGSDGDAGVATEEDEALARSLFDEELSRLEETMQSVAPCKGPVQLGRRAMFSHHIIAPSKRHAISQWAVQLRLGGMAKIGWPGIIIVEGEELNVRAYVDALSRLRWKHFVVRGEQLVEGKPGQSLDELRALPMGFEEFGTDGMSAFAAKCRECGMEELFLICLKMHGGKSPAANDKRSALVEADSGIDRRKGVRKR